MIAVFLCSAGDSFAVAMSQTLHSIKKCVMLNYRDVTFEMSSECANSYYWNCYVCLIITAALGLALSLTSVKILSKGTSVYHIAGIRGVFIGAILMCVSCCRGSSLIEPKEKLPLVIARGIIGATGFLFQTIATTKLPLSDASFLCNSYPGDRHLALSLSLCYIQWWPRCSLVVLAWRV